MLLQVAHFEPETVRLRGEGIFPRILLNLPRFSIAGEYDQLLSKARENLLREANNRPASAADALQQGQADADDADSLVELIVIFFKCKQSSFC